MRPVPIYGYKNTLPVAGADRRLTTGPAGTPLYRFFNALRYYRPPAFAPSAGAIGTAKYVQNSRQYLG
jgi:hypothetical protein